MKYVHIKNGHGHGRQLVNIDFPVIHDLKLGSRGLYVMVNGEGLVGFPQRNFRVHVQTKGDVEFFDYFVPTNQANSSEVTDATDVEVVSEPVILRGHIPSSFSTLKQDRFDNDLVIRDEEPYAVIRERMIERFAVLAQLSVAAARGVLQGLVVYGGAGVGKSYEVVDAMNSVNVYNKLKFQKLMEDEGGSNEDEDEDKIKKPNGYGGDFVITDPVLGVEVPQFYTYHVHKGHISASGLYSLLYNNRHKNEITILDDSDSVLQNEDAIGVLKSALDTTGERIVMWSISGDRSDGIPKSFVFDGSAIFITNTNFETLANSQSKIAPHIAAILDRCLYLDLMLETTQEKLVRIDYVCRDLKMFERELSYGPTAIELNEITDVSEELLQWTHDNSSQFRELSLRKMHHLAKLRKSANNWKRIAEMTLLRGRR